MESFDEEKARWTKDVWLATYPEVGLLFQEAQRQIRAGKGTASKVQHRSGRVRGGLRYTEWCNTGFQGIVADASKLWMWNVQRECWNDPSSPLYGSRMVNFVHDECMLETDEDKVHEVAERQEALGSAAMGVFCPNVRAKCESTATRRWFKGADPVYVDGRLVVGEPVKEGGKTRWVQVG